MKSKFKGISKYIWKQKFRPQSHNTSVSIGYLYVSDHMLMLNSLSNVTFPNHLARWQNLHKYLQTVFHPGLQMTSGNADAATQWAPAPLENVQTTRFSPRWIFNDLWGDWEPRVWLRSPVPAHLAWPASKPAFEQNQKWAQSLVNRSSLNLLIHPNIHHPSIYRATLPSTHTPTPIGP